MGTKKVNLDNIWVNEYKLNKTCKLQKKFNKNLEFLHIILDFILYVFILIDKVLSYYLCFYYYWDKHIFIILSFFKKKNLKYIFFQYKMLFLANVHFFCKEIIKNILGPQVILCVAYFHYFEIFKKKIGKELFV